MDHQILLSSLVKMGISGSALTWFKSYLADRSYQVAPLLSPHPLHWSSAGLGARPRPILPVHQVTWFCYLFFFSFSYHCYANDTQLFLSFSPSETQVPARISACLADISAWMSTHHLKLNLGKTELLFLPAKGSPMIDASITVEGSIVSPSQSARSDPGRPAVLLRPHRSDHLDLPILPAQHPEDLTVPHSRGHKTPGPGPGDLSSELLQSICGRPTGLCHQAIATSPECCRTSGVQSTEVHPTPQPDPSVLPPLAN
ncbi:hypothetical protein AAFF_G00027670 [Aldrovandia affinis]|uniref:Reverse transcriptase domain-containing protein n=1 Tax=Aldrovandia affinis TaxID=143900 RepID=A0AAD7S4L6_9TELE|nr:hypothetical protein AAFF_G00027670 [Aldrovandia affinis]